MGFGVDTVGNYNISALPNGKYAVACNNGNFGACQMDKEMLEAFAMKQNPNIDTFTFNLNEQPTIKNKPDFSKKVAIAMRSALLPTYDGIQYAKQTYEQNTAKREALFKKSSFFKKAAVAMASSVLPGLGQAINGQWGKAAFYAIGAPVLTLAAWCVNPILGWAVGTGLEIGNIVSAYRNA